MKKDEGKVKKERKGSRHHSDDEIEDALRKKDGLITHAAKHLDITYQAIYHRLKKSERLRDVLKESREATIDEAEKGLKEAIKEREPWAITLALKTIGKERGYVEKYEIEDTTVITVKKLQRKK